MNKNHSHFRHILVFITKRGNRCTSQRKFAATLL